MRTTQNNTNNIEQNIMQNVLEHDGVYFQPKSGLPALSFGKEKPSSSAIKIFCSVGTSTKPLKIKNKMKNKIYDNKK